MMKIKGLKMYKICKNKVNIFVKVSKEGVIKL